MPWYEQQKFGYVQKYTQPYKYNGKEYVEMGLDEYQYGFRGYYATIGRFTQIDPMAESTYSKSPYVYASNNFVGEVDFMGLWTCSTFDRLPSIGSGSSNSNNILSTHQMEIMAHNAKLGILWAWAEHLSMYGVDSYDAYRLSVIMDYLSGGGGKAPSYVPVSSGSILGNIEAFTTFNYAVYDADGNFKEYVDDGDHNIYQDKKGGKIIGEYGDGRVTFFVDELTAVGEAKKSSSNINMGSVADYMTSKADGLNGKCAAYFYRAMKFKGYYTGTPIASAKDYGPLLLQLGFTAIPNISIYSPLKGDVTVVGGNTNHPHGHIQVFNGKCWVSDGTQGHWGLGSGFINCGMGFKAYKDMTYNNTTIYRY